MDDALLQTQDGLRRVVAEVMAIEDITSGAPAGQSLLPRRRASTQNDLPDDAEAGASGRNDALRFRGQLLLPADDAYERLAAGFRRLGYTALLRQDGDRRSLVLAVPGTLRRANQRLGLAAGLFGLTLLSCLFAGAQMVEGLSSVNWNLLDGLPYAVSLLAILGAHEMGHYMVARQLGTPTSLPYFAPMPLGLGTFGAVINMVAPPRNRRHLLAIAAAGPLAGLAVALPVLLIGLSLSRVEPLPTVGMYSIEGNSILYAALKLLMFGKLLPANGEDVFIHPVAFAGWAGLLVTGLNLIPAGQLDGGHIVYALLGARATRLIFWAVLAVLAVLAFFWSGWILWMVLIFLFGRIRVMPLDDLTNLTGRQRALALAMVVIFILVFTPVPMRVVGA